MEVVVGMALKVNDGIALGYPMHSEYLEEGSADSCLASRVTGDMAALRKVKEWPE